MRIFNSTPRDDNFRMPGEFERHQGCIMIWPVRPGSWIYGGKAAKKVFAKIAAIIAQSEHVYMLADHEHLKEAQEYLKEAHEHLKEAQEQKNPKDTEAGFSETLQLKEEVHHMLERQVTCEGKGIEVVELESDDAWARDVAPTFVKNADGIVRGINWSFNAWGGDYDGLYADLTVMMQSRLCWRVVRYIRTAMEPCWLRRAVCAVREEIRSLARHRLRKS